MSKLESHEIVVLGAGVAGLLIAGELAQNHDVLVVENADRIQRTKYWLTDRGSCEANDWLTSALDTTYSQMAFTASDGTSYLARGSYVLWDSDRLIDVLVAKLRSASGSIAFGTRFVSFTTTQDGVVVHANDQQIRCKLLIDCMGHASPILYAKRVVDVLGYYLLYGAVFRLAEGLLPVALHNLMLSAHPAYIEAFPTSDGRLHIVLIVPVRGLTDRSDLRSDFHFIVSRSPYARHVDGHDSRQRRFLGGIVPVARMRRRALDHVFFFGESGQVNPAASATALTRMLYTYRSVAARLSLCIRDGRLSTRDLSQAAAPAGAINERMQRALFRNILKWDSDDYRRVVHELIAIDDPDFVNALMFGSLDEELVPLGRWLRSLIGARSTTLLGALLRGIAPFS